MGKHDGSIPDQVDHALHYAALSFDELQAFTDAPTTGLRKALSRLERAGRIASYANGSDVDADRLPQSRTGYKRWKGASDG
jgi:hypothetical protein